ncbi:MAG: hypothetical protein COT91_04095 [Candidatus Doudnabacteria bacterium CG10_big_fil_rev_8_21_14_0_10_41_10]|uniref:GGDEF domain-containing protein n=1 Tax=Candidatus Doudnabacteria bacterium CG10_big_fil_rev_8_21_14_0_10_41_10 TaxID=1974551 RepID=A0A2H0VCY0_9BACT|nr:MAG: hypothetical protein COT91_04095 [Candidatus Doudnabacteria bacterium CG10_big_fil_rev_8_21_14_0_10_41_10]
MFLSKFLWRVFDGLWVYLKVVWWRGEDLRVLVEQDYMTRVFNKREFLRRSAVRLRRAQARGQTCYILFLDLDGLKALNDSSVGGYAEGDRLIISFSAIIRLREADLVGRMGGDEFVIVTTEGADGLAIRIEEIATEEGISFSCGIASHDSDGTVFVWHHLENKRELVAMDGGLTACENLKALIQLASERMKVLKKEKIAAGNKLVRV